GSPHAPRCGHGPAAGRGAARARCREAARARRQRAPRARRQAPGLGEGAHRRRPGAAGVFHLAALSRIPEEETMARALAFLIAALFTCAAHAQEWAPTKPVRIIVPIVGSTNDVLARLFAPGLQQALGQPVVVENKG